MAKNYVQRGKTLTLTAPSGGVVSGLLYVIGKLIVIASFSANADEEFEAHRGEVWRLPKAAGEVPVEGAEAFISTSDEVKATGASGDRFIGHFAKAGEAADTECDVLLFEGSAPDPLP